MGGAFVDGALVEALFVVRSDISPGPGKGFVSGGSVARLGEAARMAAASTTAIRQLLQKAVKKFTRAVMKV
jgi:hypothetical protein